jgi:predicted DNA-binding protein (MmcQ/YjbR family)
MDVEQLRNYCLSKPGAEESFPFDNETLVFKADGKMFLLASLDASPLKITVKCDPEMAIELRENYSCILPGYHMNKKYWNTVIIDGALPGEMLRKFIDNSYELVKGNKKKASI